MNEIEYKQKQINEQRKLILEYPNKPGVEKDIWNLKYMITEIAPGSRAWRSGHVGSLRRAIRALEREVGEQK